MLSSLRQLAAQMKPTRAEQKAQANYRRLPATQQVATIHYLVQQVKKQREHGKNIDSIARLLGLFVTNSTSDTQTERRSTAENDSPTERTGVGNANSAPPS